MIEHFSRQICAQNNWKLIYFSPEAIRLLTESPWPGNVRELRNMVERLMLLAENDQVSSSTVQSALPAGSLAKGTGPLADRVQAFERETILAELRRQNFHITNTAKALGLERSHLYKKAEQLAIDIGKQRVLDK